MNYRFATLDDCAFLADWNHQLIRDEGHRNRMTPVELEQRMRTWLSSEYRAVVFEQNLAPVAYALFRENPHEVYLRQLFVARDCRRQGIGRGAVGILRSNVWPKSKRLTVDVLVANAAAIEFWRAVGYQAYCLTLEILPST